MRPGSESTSRLVLSLALPLVCVLLAIAAYATFGGALPLSAHGYRVHVPLPDAENLVPGSDVRTSGVRVGTVVSVSRDGNRASATLELRRDFVPMRSGATAIVRAKTLLGEAYLEVAPGDVAAPAIPEDGWLAPDRVRRTVKLDEFLSTFSPETRDRMRALFTGTAAAFDGRSQSLSNTLVSGASFSVDLDTAMRAVNGQNRQLRRLFASSGEVLDALGHRAGALQGTITAANDLLDITARRDRELAATIKALPPFLRALDGLSVAVSAVSPDLRRAVTALRPTIRPLGRVVEGTIGIAPQMRTALRAYAKTTVVGRRALPALTRIVKATPAATDGLYPAARELVPFLQLLGAYRRQGLVGPLAIAASAGNGKSVGPGGKIVSRGGGMIYTSNESVAGWVKRLPTDRSNPYPTPEGLLDFARQGFLSSYDCRHLGNTLFLPPIGSGVPPCVTQGPWTYRGKSAYYPRLTEAPK